MATPDFSLNLPYITADLPGIGGQLRAEPDHFVVEELPLYEPQGDGPHLYVNVTKVGLTTKDVQKQLEQLFGLRSGDVGFAGMKDKQARTTQTFSIPIELANEQNVDAITRRLEQNLPVTLNWMKRHRNKLKTGHLLGNRFHITVTDSPLAPTQMLANAQAIVQRLRADGAPNFFGVQRFGDRGHNIERGYALLTGQQRIKDRWLRRFLVSSYQSYLCNCYLARRLEMVGFAHLLLGDVAKKYETGGIFTVEDVAVEQPRYAAQEISFTAPLFGAKMRSAEAEAGQLEESILAESGISIKQFQAARMDGTRRLGRLLVPDLAVQIDSAALQASGQTDTSVTENPAKGSMIVTFTLPKGAFATTIMREVMKVDMLNAPNEDLDE